LDVEFQLPLFVKALSLKEEKKYDLLPYYDILPIDNNKVGKYRELVNKLISYRNDETLTRKCKRGKRASTKYQIRRLYSSLNLSEKRKCCNIYKRYLLQEPKNNNTNYILEEEGNSFTQVKVKNGNIDWDNNILKNLSVTGLHIQEEMFDMSFEKKREGKEKDEEKEKKEKEKVKQGLALLREEKLKLKKAKVEEEKKAEEELKEIGVVLNKMVEKSVDSSKKENTDKKVKQSNNPLETRLENSKPNSKKIQQILKQEQLDTTIRNVFEIGKRFGNTICCCSGSSRRESKRRNKNNAEEANKRHNEIHFVFCFLNICTEEEKDTLMHNYKHWQHNPRLTLKRSFREQIISHREAGETFSYVSLEAKYAEEDWMEFDYMKDISALSVQHISYDYDSDLQQMKPEIQQMLERKKLSLKSLEGRLAVLNFDFNEREERMRATENVIIKTT